jgi:hypothetical protein
MITNGNQLINLMDASILRHIDVPPNGIGCVYTMSIVDSMLHGSVYDVIIGCYLICTCIDFISVLSSSIKIKNISPMQTFVFHLCQKDIF